jgi:amidohydrolase
MILPVIVAGLLLAGEPPQAPHDLSTLVPQLTRAVMPSVIEWRRDFHAHPELSNREERTAAKVAEHLRAMGVDQIKTGVAHHGVVALIRGQKEGPTVALRADMDALPIVEQTGLPFASQNRGVMHACGHDSHTAMLLGVASVLAHVRDQIPGSVKLIFQPAEEGAPAGEAGGASLMVQENVLADPEVAAIFALHVNPELTTGTLGYRPGAALAASDSFQVTVTGKQSHGAMPWQGVDPIVTSAAIITAIQTIQSRGIDARKPVVVSVGAVHGGTAWNVIPGQVTLQGTIRTYDADVRAKVLEQFRRIVEHTALAHGATAQVSLRSYGPAVWNDPKLGQRMKPTLLKTAGQQNLIEVEPMMGSEDFAYFAQKKPGLYFFLGVQNKEAHATGALHTPTLVIDEGAMPLGVQTLATLAIDFLQGEAARVKEADSRQKDKR